MILGHGGEFDFIGKSEQSVNLVEQLSDSYDLVAYLLGSEKNMRVVLREASDSEKSVKRARKLVSVHLAEFAVTKRKLLI